MNLRKSIFSYIIWAAFAVLCCLAIIFALDTAEITKMSGWPCVAVAGAACAYLLLTAAVYFALRTLCTEAGRHIGDRERLESVTSVVLPVLILVGAVAYLVLYMLYHIPLTLADDSFYRQAYVTVGVSVPYAVHGASWLYPCLLHVMLLVFGNTPFAGVVLQIALFFICLLLLYIGMQAFAGTLPAAVSMAVLGFLPVSLQFVFSLTPELFYLALYLLGFCLAGALFRKCREGSSVSPGLYLFTFLLGLYIGFLVYLDLYSISLLLFLAVLYSLDSGKVKQAFMINLTALLGGAAGFVISLLSASQMGEMGLSAYLRELLRLYTQDAHLGREMIESVLLPDTTLVGSLLTVSFAFFVIPAFFIWKRSQNSAFIVNLFLVYAMSAFHVFRFSGQMIATFSWSVLAGLGFYGVVRRTETGDEADEEESSGKKKVRKVEVSEKNADQKEEIPEQKTAQKEVISEKNTVQKDELSKKKTARIEEISEKDTAQKEEILEQKTAGKDEISGKKIARKEEKIPEQKTVLSREIVQDKKTASGKEKNSEKRTNGGMTTMDTETTIIEKKEQEKPAPGQPLHNPLPVPQKRSRPQVDFTYQVGEADMKFDVEVADDDDFDV